MFKIFSVKLMLYFAAISQFFIYICLRKIDISSMHSVMNLYIYKIFYLVDILAIVLIVVSFIDSSKDIAITLLNN